MSVQIFSPFLIGLFVLLLSCKCSLYSLLTSSLLNVHFVNICSHTFLFLNSVFFFLSRGFPFQRKLQGKAVLKSQQRLVLWCQVRTEKQQDYSRGALTDRLWLRVREGAVLTNTSPPRAVTGSRAHRRDLRQVYQDAGLFTQHVGS